MIKKIITEKIAMKLMHLIRHSLVVSLLLPAMVSAAAPAWKIVHENSSLAFAAIQNGAPVTGTFAKFDGTINFDLKHLNDCKVKIIVDMNSLSTSYNDLTATLKTPDWFNIKLFPQAVFEESICGERNIDHSQQDLAGYFEFYC
jgi:polyisoprenoid-binding protein YceI